jgi:hypothetical protein
MAEKLTSNEETLSDDGIVAGDAPPVVLPPPHAMTASPASMSTGTSLANLNVALSYQKRSLLPSSRRIPGRECAGKQVSTQQPWRPRRRVQSIAQARQFVKTSVW